MCVVWWRIGMTARGITADAATSPAATQSAPVRDHAISGPDKAEPSGEPSWLSAIEIANILPNAEGSDRLITDVLPPVDLLLDSSQDGGHPD